jgi:hypothetical protein
MAHDEASYSPFSKVSGAAGTVVFVDWSTLRSCPLGWFQCGESSYEFLGSALEAAVVRRGKDGTLEWSSLARRDCGHDPAGDCDTAAHRPRLRLVDGKLEVSNVDRPPDAQTIAWSGMREFELDDDAWLCTTAALPGAADAVLLKIAPQPTMAGIDEVLFALKRVPTSEGEEGACVPVAGLPLPAGRPDRKFLADALRDDRGRLELVYLVKNDPYDWEFVRIMVAVYDHGWRAGEEVPRKAVDDANPLLMPGFLDSAADSLVMSVGDARARPGFALRRYYRRGGEVRVEQPRRR